MPRRPQTRRKRAGANCRQRLACPDNDPTRRDGYELASRLIERLGARLHLVAVTGYGQEHDRARARAAGFQRHFVKPVPPGQLLQYVGTVGRVAQGGDRLRAV